METLQSSFRDPSGFVFQHQGDIYRQVNKNYATTFDSATEAGLFDTLTQKGYLIPHEDVTDSIECELTDYHKIIKPEKIPYISYPYEWCFSQLKDAAMLTLRIQSLAMKKGFTLKDASAYNVQFINGSPIFIDTLSFAIHEEGSPWEGYRQFCQHFLAPLALMAYVDVDLRKLLIANIDGIPLSLASKMLPTRTRFKSGLQMHLHLHAKMQNNFSDSATQAEAQHRNLKNSKVSKAGLQAIIESLASAIDDLDWKLPKTEWGDYYEHTNYDDQSTEQKRITINRLLQRIPDPLSIIQDLGANTGEFSRIAAQHASLVISQDIDPVAVERNYQHIRNRSSANVLPLVQDLFSPSPAIGWANTERDSFSARAKCDCLLALALIHHLAISNNTPLSQIASFFSSVSNWLIIEFVPKSDSQVARLLKTRADIFPNYTEDGFQHAFGKHFVIEQQEKLPGTQRTLYLMSAIKKHQQQS